MLLKRNKTNEYECPSYHCTFVTQNHFLMQNHLRRGHPDAELVSRRQGASVLPAVSLQMPHHGVDNEQRMIDADHDDDDVVVVRGSDPNEDDMSIGSPDDLGDRDRQIHSSPTPSYRRPATLFSVHHSPSYDRDVFPQVPTQRITTLTVPESAIPEMINERDKFGELCPRYPTKHITYTPKQKTPKTEGSALLRSTCLTFPTTAQLSRHPNNCSQSTALFTTLYGSSFVTLVKLQSCPLASSSIVAPGPTKTAPLLKLLWTRWFNVIIFSCKTVLSQKRSHNLLFRESHGPKA